LEDFGGSLRLVRLNRAGIKEALGFAFCGDKSIPKD
jgi:hypothetical protein